MNRYLLATALCRKPLFFSEQGPLCSDIMVMLQALIETGLQSKTKNRIYCHDAGTVARFLPALLLHYPGEHEIIPSPQMAKRPMKELFDAFAQAGIKIKASGAEKLLPWSFVGQQYPQQFSIDIRSDISSQFISALIFFFAAYARESKLHLSGETVSTPYINMTIAILRQFGKTINFDKNTILIGKEALKTPSLPLKIERDWSCAAFLIAKALLNRKKLFLSDLSTNSLQGDAAFLKMILKMGAKAENTTEGLIVYPCHTLKGLSVDLSQTPDLAPVLFVMAPFLKNPSSFYGLSGLRHKESNRLNALCAGLCRAGFALQRQKNKLRIFPSQGKRCTIDCYNDHRIAMAFGLLPQKFRLNNPQVVIKSFPNYFTEINKI